MLDTNIHTEEGGRPQFAENDTVTLDAALKRLGGDTALLRELIGFFLEDAPELLQRVEQSLEQRNSEELARAAHSLKGLASNFDDEPCVNVAARIERLAKAGDLEGAAQNVDELTQSVQSLHAQLESLSH